MTLLCKLFYSSLFLLALVSLTACQTATKKIPAKNAKDVLFAHKLWQAMERKHLVGSASIPLKPFFGGAKPHGRILEIYNHKLTMGNHKGFLILKRNYNGKGVSIHRVSKNRKKYLTAITIMYQRKAGYDNDNLNMFWAKYKPDGTLFTRTLAGHKMQLAGRLIKGKTRADNKGCLYCHASAGGGDYIFYPNIKLPGFHYPKQ